LRDCRSHPRRQRELAVARQVILVELLFSLNAKVILQGRFERGGATDQMPDSCAQPV
jgi:hypothetical protein